MPVLAGAAEPFGKDGIDRTDPNFVRASLLVMGPGEELYSCAGHACLRMECPKFNLDYCFSYESEAVRDRVWAFLSGRLKMGMFAVPTADFLKTYAEEGRGVMAYPLDLPPDAKQRLWKLLDEKAAEGAELQYDFIRRGCAQSTIQYLFEAVRPYPIAYPPWSAKYDQTLRELFGVALADHPWNLFILNFLVGTDVDANLPKIKRVIIPADLAEFLRGVKVAGKPILAGEPVVLAPATAQAKRAWLNPVMAAVAFLVLVVAGLWCCPRMTGLTLAVMQAALGVMLMYLVLVSTLPATTWNWLIVPFNPLPLVFWKWRRYWALLFAVALVGWLGFLILASHQMTHPAYYVLVAAYILFYAVGVRRDEI